MTRQSFEKSGSVISPLLFLQSVHTLLLASDGINQPAILSSGGRECRSGCFRSTRTDSDPVGFGYCMLQRPFAQEEEGEEAYWKEWDYCSGR